MCPLPEEFMDAVKHLYGEKVLIQGTASVVLAGLLSSLKVVGGNLAEHTYLFLCAREAGTGIAELIALEVSKQTNAPIESAATRFWLVDSKYPLHTVLAFDSRQHVVSIAWVITRSVTKQDTLKFLHN